MKRSLSFSFVAALACAVASAFAGDPVRDIEIHGLKFAAPVTFSAPASAGLDALRMVHPADAKGVTEKLSLTAVAFPKDCGMSDAELIEYVATTFLATGGSGKPVVRTLLGQKADGQAFEKKIPTPSRAEVYVATRKNGDKVVLGFVFPPTFAKEAEAAIAGIATTLKESSPGVEAGTNSQGVPPKP